MNTLDSLIDMYMMDEEVGERKAASLLKQDALKGREIRKEKDEALE